MNALFRIYKKDNESLRAYFNRYWEWCSDIHCDVSMKVSCFRDGLPKGHSLTASLVKKPPKDYNDLSDRLEKYILLEENDKAYDRRASSPPRRSKERGESEEGRRTNRNSKARPSRERRGEERRVERIPEKVREARDEQKTPAETVHAIFNTPIGKIMHQIKNEGYFQWPRPLRKEPHSRDQKLRCAYHQDCGHITDNCRTLLYHLNDLAGKGHLKKFLKEERSKSDRGYVRPEKRHRDPDVEEDHEWQKRESRGTINAIHGVVRRNHAHQRSQRAEVHSAAMAEQVVGFDPNANIPTVTAFPPGVDESEVSFSNADLVGLDIPHNDALVISLNIDTWDVHKVLVDPGSSTEIMYYNLFQKIQPAEVREMEFPIYSFSGQAIFPIGVTTLTVRAGPVAKRVDFVIIGEESPYMAILGRTWLNSMKAIASPYHQKLRFPCSKGIVTVRGSQQEARICFGHAIRSALTETRPDTGGPVGDGRKSSSLVIREKGEEAEKKRRKDESKELPKDEGKRPKEA